MSEWKPPGRMLLLLAVQTKGSYARSRQQPQEPLTLPSWYIPTNTATNALYGFLAALPRGHSSPGKSYVL